MLSQSQHMNIMFFATIQMLINFLACCDIFVLVVMSSMRRWKGGRNVKLEGSDHVPVYMSLVEIPNIQPHNTPPLSTRYCPQVYGCQQTLGASPLLFA